MIEDYIKLKLTPGLTEKQLFTVFSRRGNLRGIFKERVMTLTELGFSQKSAQNIRGNKYSSVALKRNLRDIERINKVIPCGLITLEDDNYPESLRNISAPPVSFFYLGDTSFLHKPAITIVGARKTTPDGEQVARQLSSALSEIGFTIVSGFAYGIDITAHLSAYKNMGGTIAVLGSGLMDIYPAHHKKYVRDICKNGCFVSEFAMNEPPSRFNFPQRNRIVSALGIGTIVVEASLKSGSLITAHMSMEQGKPVMTIPSHPASGSSGTNKLIKDGAALVENYMDVVDEILPIITNYGKPTNSHHNHVASFLRNNANEKGNAQATSQGNAEATSQGNAQASPQGNAQATSQGNAQAASQGNAQASPQGNAQAASQGNAQASPQGNGNRNAPQPQTQTRTRTPNLYTPTPKPPKPSQGGEAKKLTPEPTQNPLHEYNTIEEGIIAKLRVAPMFGEDILKQIPHNPNEIFSAITALELQDTIAKGGNGEYYLV